MFIPFLPLANTASSFAHVILGLALIGVLLGCGAVCAMKGKWVFFVLGWFSGIFWIVGACRLGKPNSYWAKRRYGTVKLREAQLNFPGKHG
jgi:hypothetical protein